MAWVEVDISAPSLTVTKQGGVSWNTALQLLMGDPIWVDLMWDATAHTLGVRAVNSPTGIPVEKNPGSSEYSIDSANALAAAGISTADTVTAAPDSWIQREAPGAGSPGWFGYLTIYYVTLLIQE